MEAQISDLTPLIRRAIRRYFRPGVATRRDLWSVVTALQGAEAYVFGGLVGDLLSAGPSAIPRDVDIVVSGLDVGEIEERLSNLRESLTFGKVRQNRFGGINAVVGRWRVDIWPVQHSWAFRVGLVEGGTVAELPRTTFLNVEAIAVEVSPERAARIFDGGFSAAWTTKCLDINLEENPDPLRSALRALFSAAKYRFALSSRLADYVLTQAAHLPPDKLEAIERRHFGQRRFGGETLARWIASIEVQRQNTPDIPVHLPLDRSEQLQIPLG